MKLLLLAIAACTLAAGCRSSGSADDGIPFRTIARGSQSGLAGSDIEIARTEDEWRALWKRHTSTSLPRPDLPPVDFEHDMVICLLLGPKPTTGYEIQIVHARPKDGGLYLQAIGTTPAFGAIMPQVVSQPYHMIAVPRSDGVVTARTETQGPNSP